MAAGAWTLQVSDNAGIDPGTLDSWSLVITGSFGAPPPPPPSSIALAIGNAERKGQSYKIDLGWSGATGGSVDIHRNGAFLTTTSNSGSYRDSVSTSVGNTFTCVVCEQGSATACSNQATASF